MSRNMTVIEEILKCKSTEELNSIIDDINMALKSARGTISSRKKMEFTRGDVVLVKEKNGRKSEGIILKINRTRAEVGINGVSWRVPFTHMELKENE